MRSKLTNDQFVVAVTVGLVVAVFGFAILLGEVVYPATLEDGYYQLEDLTTDQYVEQNEDLQPPYFQGKELPNLSPLECGIERMVPLNTYLGEKQRPDGTTWYYFDTNGDGIFDVTMSLPTDDENRYPVLYFFDRDYVQSEDGPTPEIGYVDVLRNGKCLLGADGNIRIYWTPKMADDAGKIGESDCVRGDCDKRQEGDL